MVRETRDAVDLKTGIVDRFVERNGEQTPPAPKRTTVIRCPDTTLFQRGADELKEKGVLNNPWSLLRVTYSLNTSQGTKEEEVGS